MRFRKPGLITNNLWYLGSEESGVYYLEGSNGAALINGAMAYVLPNVLTQMREFGIDPGRVTKFLILHSHFDHVGIVPYFKRNYPAIDLIASEAAVAILGKPKALETINSLNRLSAGEAHIKLDPFDLDWRGDFAVTGIREGDTVDLGGATLQIFETPGHSNCSIAAYEPGMHALFASDAVGIPFSNQLFPSMNTNIDQYMASLDKLASLEVSLLCADHYGYITGEEAARFVSKTASEGLEWTARLIDCLDRHNTDIESAAKEFTATLYLKMPGYFIAPEILEGVFKQVLKYIVKTRCPAE